MNVVSEDKDLEPIEDEELDETDEETASEEPEEAEEWTPPTKAEFSRLQRQLKRANAQAKKAKEGKPSEDQQEEAKTKGFTEAETKYKPLLVHAEARAQLSAMGLKGDAKKFLRLLDLEDIDVEEDGEISGLEEQLDGFKEDFPELFDARRLKGDKRTRADASDRQPATSSHKTTAQLLADQALGRK